jgi:hypothetical protein
LLIRRPRPTQGVGPATMGRGGVEAGEEKQGGREGVCVRAGETLEGRSAVTAACKKRIVDAESSIRIRAWPHV